MSIFDSIDDIDNGIDNKSLTIEYLKEVLGWGLYERGSLLIKVIYKDKIENSDIFISFNKRNYINDETIYEYMETYLPIKSCVLTYEPWMYMSYDDGLNGLNINNYGVMLTKQEIEGRLDLRSFYIENVETYRQYILSQWVG